METYPKMCRQQGELIVEFAPSSQESCGQSLRMVLDLDRFGELLGIEIINLLLKAGGDCLGIIRQIVRADGESMRYSHDEESDCFYLRLAVGESVDQKAIDGSVFLDQYGRITRLSVQWPQ